MLIMITHRIDVLQGVVPKLAGLWRGYRMTEPTQSCLRGRHITILIVLFDASFEY